MSSQGASHPQNPRKALCGTTNPLTIFLSVFPTPLVNEIRSARRRMSTLDDKQGKEDLALGELSIRDSKEESDKVRHVKSRILLEVTC